MKAFIEILDGFGNPLYTIEVPCIKVYTESTVNENTYYADEVIKIQPSSRTAVKKLIANLAHPQYGCEYKVYGTSIGGYPCEFHIFNHKYYIRATVIKTGRHNIAYTKLIASNVSDN